MLFRQKGFTLIEILIVIAILGALALGLLATLDPFQQVKKGNDTTTRNMVSDIYRGLISFQATQGSFPWTTPITAMVATDLAMTEAGGYLPQIIDTGELKEEFIALAGSNLEKIFISSTDIMETLSVCFLPGSKSFLSDPSTQYTISGDATTGCSVSSPCYWCVK